MPLDQPLQRGLEGLELRLTPLEEERPTPGALNMDDDGQGAALGVGEQAAGECRDEGVGGDRGALAERVCGRRALVAPGLRDGVIVETGRADAVASEVEGE